MALCCLQAGYPGARFFDFGSTTCCAIYRTDIPTFPGKDSLALADVMLLSSHSLQPCANGGAQNASKESARAHALPRQRGMSLK